MAELVNVDTLGLTQSPPGGIVPLGKVSAGQIGWFGDDDVKIGYDSAGHPAIPDTGERELGRWIAESSSAGMFEVIGTWISGDSINQGPITAGSDQNFLLLTDKWLRITVPSRKSQVRTGNGVAGVPNGHIYAFAIELAELELIDGNKRDVAIAASTEALKLHWARSADASWSKISKGGPWHKDNDEFAVAVLNATIDVKLTHSNEKVRASAEKAKRQDQSRAFATGKRSSFEFESP